MELESGYKKTELGSIPSDWFVKELNDISTITRLAGYEYSSVWEEDENGEIIALRGFNIGQNRIIDKDFVRISNKLSLKLNRSRLYKGNIVYPCVGTIGNASVIEVDNKYHIQQNIAKIIPNETHVNSYYLAYYLMSSFGLNEIMKFNGTSSQPNILVGSLRKYSIILPPLPEQQIIAEVLSNTDNLIQSFEKLIEKKRLIKQGAMQKLFTPKEGWEVKKLPEVCWFQEGPGLRKWQFTRSGIKVINVTNLVNGYLDLDRTDRHISMAEFEKMYKHFEIDAHDILMASSGNSYSKVSVVREKDLRLVMNTSVIRFKPINGLDYNFLLIFLKSTQFKEQIDLLITGGAQPNFGPAHLKKINICIPPTKEEQIYTASVLMEIDLEIELLEKKLSKFKSLKQALMQNLLTGKIRLIKS